MGAAAYGDNDRVSNAYYPSLRQLVCLSQKGQVFINRSLIKYHYGGIYFSYGSELEAVIGPPIKRTEMWRSDRVLGASLPIDEETQKRLDIAAALQMVFEDALNHILHYWVEQTGARQIILTGGTALNCIANHRFIKSLREKSEKSISFKVWIPPTPCDSGIPMGAAIAFAMTAGLKPGRNVFPNVYSCGSPFSIETILNDIELYSKNIASKPVRYSKLGNIKNTADLNKISDLMAETVSKNSVIGLFQGAAETGPRALGNRSILANAADPDALLNINQRVKYRESLRPLAPTVTAEDASKYFEFPEDGFQNFENYEYMTVAVKARREAIESLPSCVHVDGTCRVQVVKKTVNPLFHSYLQALKRRIGFPVSINTSFNVGTPIVNSPLQATDAFERARDMDGVFFVSDTGEVVVLYKANERCTLKDIVEEL